MKYSRLFILLFVILAAMGVKAQETTEHVIWPVLGKNDTIRVAATNDGGYMIPWIALQEVKIMGLRIWRSAADQAAFNRLRYNVLKVMPYALYAKRRYEKLERDLALVNDKKTQKKLVKECDNEIKKMFNTEIKELTITQGQILTKLIDREVGRTTYDIVKQTKGGFAAFSYQLVARVVGHNLKTTYSATEDKDIESIIVNSGYYQQ
ncbi:DUF4294 domain-containing protein [Pedobacter frigiditerrae]|uniref:DUF4294 domain-containing protein n=1 Tax=Pedobacter frigiditerrae TaxID=2530452 RepID=A0A4R0MUC7_9SPHI|nr:DUF4294 domain-containing protein [Pedobacter frigiditerrae]TCC89494.1 DUF4294 domain-containing protein [Pedobacter frigiditerrae]